MKNFAFIVLLFSLLLSCENDDEMIGYDKIELTPYIIENYYHDAKQLYFDEIINNDTHFNYNNSILDDNEIDKVLKIIQAVYDSESPQRDTVFDVYNIHSYHCYGFNEIYLEVHTELNEIQNLSENIIPTGESSLDGLLATYNFNSVKTFYSYPRFPRLTISTPNEYNLIPIVKEFESLESVITTDYSRGCAGDGNHITLKRENSYSIITFSIGQGDCPAGCGYHKYWEFKVSNGKAEFIRTYD